ncbi:MAG: hypothetical protein K0S27_12 [Gammaproteobacteria bacterium]|jgi:hypothetical protein|nr:hypothetical protein [Gammaproteobacteria bacterium]
MVMGNIRYNSSVHGFFIISLIAGLFGYWFAQQQLLFLSPDAFASYPKIYFFITILKCFFTIFVFFLLTYLLMRHFSRKKLGVLTVATAFFPLLFVYLHCPLYLICMFIIVVQLACLFCKWRAKDYSWLVTTYSVDLIALVLLLLLHLIFTSEFSPLHWKFSLITTTTEPIPILAPLYKSYAQAKQFAFSTMDYAEWAGILNPPITLASPLLQFLTLILDLPSINPVTFHMVLAAINFLLIIVGSFGCYLFLKYAAKIHAIYAFLGGYLMFFGVSPYLRMMQQADGGVFLSSYGVFPYCLLLLSLAFEKKNYLLSTWAGLALASQFFILTPHPEGIIYSVFFLGIYALGLMIFSPYSRWYQRVLLTAVTFFSFFLLTAYIVVPTFIDQYTGNMHTISHLNIGVSKLDDFKVFKCIFLIFTPLSLLLLWRNRESYPTYLSSLFFCLFLYAIFISTTNMHFNHIIMQFFHIGLHIDFPWRIGMYVCLSIFIIATICLDSLANHFMRLIIFLVPGK